MTNERPISEAKSSRLRGSWTALKRAAERAHQIAAQTGTAVVIQHEGRIVHIYPKTAVTASGVREGEPGYGDKT